jgi:quercetin dioxygenase-like cupin family protein
VIVLPGQKNPPHDNPREHIIYVQEGKMGWRIPWPDGPYYQLGPEDRFFVPGDMMYQYFNDGPGPLRFLSISSYQGPDTPGAGFITDVYSPVEIRLGDESTGEVLGPAHGQHNPSAVKAVEPILLRNEDVQADPTWDAAVSGSDKWGYHRFSLTMLHGTSISCTPIILLPGQRNNPHDNPREHIIYVQEGKMGWRIPWPDGPYYQLGPEDRFFVPGDMMYQYFNDGPGPLRFLSISAYQGPDTPGAGFVTEVYSRGVELRHGDEATGKVVSTHRLEESGEVTITPRVD